MKLLFATDGSPCSLNAMREGSRLLGLTNAQVSVVSVTDPEGVVGINPNAEADLAQARALFEELGCPIEPILARGTPAQEILAAARRTSPDVIVIGASSLGTFGRFIFGSVSDDVLHGWTGAVLVIKHAA